LQKTQEKILENILAIPDSRVAFNFLNIAAFKINQRMINKTIKKQNQGEGEGSDSLHSSISSDTPSTSQVESFPQMFQMSPNFGLSPPIFNPVLMGFPGNIQGFSAPVNRKDSTPSDDSQTKSDPKKSEPSSRKNSAPELKNDPKYERED
jgi:hypothetical protein